MSFDLSEIPAKGPYTFRRYDSARQFKIVRMEGGRIRCYTKTSGDLESDEGWTTTPSGDLPPADESPLRDVFAKLKGVSREALAL